MRIDGSFGKGMHNPPPPNTYINTQSPPTHPPTHLALLRPRAHVLDPVGIDRGVRGRPQVGRPEAEGAQLLLVWLLWIELSG